MRSGNEVEPDGGADLRAVRRIDRGLAPGWGSCTRMQRFAGRRRAKEINLLAYDLRKRSATMWADVRV